MLLGLLVWIIVQRTSDEKRDRQCLSDLLMEGFAAFEHLPMSEKLGFRGAYWAELQ